MRFLKNSMHWLILILIVHMRDTVSAPTMDLSTHTEDKPLLMAIDVERNDESLVNVSLRFKGVSPILESVHEGRQLKLKLLNTVANSALPTQLKLSDAKGMLRQIQSRSDEGFLTLILVVRNDAFEYVLTQESHALRLAIKPAMTMAYAPELTFRPAYQGNRLSLNFQDIDVRSVLQVLADFTGLNVVAADTVSGNVTLRLNEVPWDQALDLIMKTKGLSKRQEGNVLLIAPASEIMKFEREQLEAQKVIDALVPLKTELIQIHYAKAAEICSILLGFGNAGQTVQLAASSNNQQQIGCGSHASVLHQQNTPEMGMIGRNESARIVSSRGVVIIDARTNTLIIKDTPQALAEIRKMIALLDVPIRQVLIETRIVVANTSFARNLGAKLGVRTQAKEEAKQDGLAELGYTLQTATAVATGGMSTMAATLASGANHLLDMEIQAMQADGLGEQIANPRVMTTDRVRASISQGVQIPFTTQTANSINTNFKDAVLQLEVTPQITPGGSVIMELDITRDSQGKNIITGGQENVAIDKRGIKTKVQVEDGETLILGGVYESYAMDNQNLVPWLADIPGLGWLFRAQNRRDDKTELLVFVTPKIVNVELSANR